MSITKPLELAYGLSNLTNLTSKTIRLRLVEVEDAEFIFLLRTDNRYNQHISDIDDDLEKQRAWLRAYKKAEARGEQYYFIIERRDGRKCGTVRVYDLQEESFSWGSWILNNEKSRSAAIESMMLAFKLGFEFLGYENSHFEARKKNIKAVSYILKCGAIITSEDDDYVYLGFDKATYSKKLRDFARFL